MTKKSKIISLTLLASILVLLAGIISGVTNFMIKYSLAPYDKEDFRLSDPDNWIIQKGNEIDTLSFDGHILKAYEIKSGGKSHKYAIFMHGYHGSPLQMADYALPFYQKNYNILVPGQRGHGWSGGKVIDMGIFARKDIVTWVNLILAEDKDAEILLYGVSMGAASVMMACGQKLPANVKCAVEDCGYSSVWEQFRYILKRDFHLPAFPVLPLVDSCAKRRYGFDFKSISPKTEIHNSNIPMLFIHGTQDTYVPFEMLDQVFNSAICEKEKLIVKDAVHAKSIYTEPELYRNTVDRFVSKYIK